MTYEEALEYIHGLYWRGEKSGLEKTKEMLALCGHPEKSLSFVHIAGTNGKGSTAAMLASVCKCAGIRVGLYTSPYIVRYNERIQVDGEEIPDMRLVALTKYLAAVVEQMKVPPSEFEFGTVLALLYFKEQNCDLVILETGLGGTFDSTNAIEQPLLCIITALGFDHMAQLGSTMTEIASAKAGIIKYGVPVVFYGENKEGEAVIRKRCMECSAPFMMPSFQGLHLEALGSLSDCQQFSYYRETKDGKIVWEHLFLALPGLYQQKNAAVVLEAVELLRKKGIAITERAVRKGFCKVRWQARLELLHKEPLLLADGSHNALGMQATVESLRQYFPGRKLQFIFGGMADKELDAMAAMFLPLAKKVYLTAPKLSRAVSPEKLLTICKSCCTREEKPEFVLCPTAEQAVRLAQQGKKEEITVVIGSLYLAREVKQMLLHL